MPNYIYVSLQDEDTVLIFRVDSGTGTLTPQGALPLQGGPSAMAMSPDQKVLYVSHRNVPGISSYQIDPHSGALTQTGSATPEAAPTFLAPDRKGRFLLGAYYQGAHVGVHPLGADGSVGGAPVAWLETSVGAHAIQVDRSNRFVFVPHIARIADNVLQPPGDAYGPNAIYQFTFDETTGRLTPNTPPILAMQEFLGPRHYCFHPTLDVVYFSNEQGSSVSAYQLDTTAGTLSVLQTVTTLPGGYSGRNTCSQIQISPSGKFLYVPNRGHNSIAGFSVNPSSGELTLVGIVPTEAVPSAFSLDPEGKFLFAAGSASDRLASYRIDSDSGALTPIDTYDVGKRPMEVCAVNLGN